MGGIIAENGREGEIWGFFALSFLVLPHSRRTRKNVEKWGGILL